MLYRSRRSRRPRVSQIAIALSLHVPLALLLSPAAGGAAPVTQEVRVAAGADDAEQTSQGYFSTTSSDLELAVSGDPQTIGMRFQGLSVPRGALVSNAWVQFQVDETSSGGVALSIHGEAADDAHAYATGDDVLSRVPTTASVAWSPPAWSSVGEQGLAQRTPDLSAVVQEIVDRPGWGIGQSLAILIIGSGTRVAESYDGDPNGAPLLHVEYELSGQQAPSVAAGPDQVISLPAEALLSGQVTDDGLPDPPGQVTTSWSRVSGPGSVTFGDPSALATTASFALGGSYVLRLSANDGEKVGTDDLRVTVNSGSGGPVIGSFTPASAQVASVISLSGSGLGDVEEVDFDGVRASFWIESDGLLHATVPPGAATGPILVTNAFGSAVSAEDFVVVASPTVLVGAGDISNCSGHADDTANLLDEIPGTVFTAGDHAYADGTPSEFAQCYDPTWGRHRERTRPSPGEVDYDTPDAAGYFGYFGPTAGEPGKGYYSYDVGDWHVVALNSQCGEVGGCGSESPQGRWLREDLVRNASTCTLAYWASPRFSSGDRHGSDPTYTDFWQILYGAGAEIVVNGHDHIYERFAPQRGDGTPDPLGIREFVVGTGGYSLYTVSSPEPNSEVHDTSTHGVLKLTLHPTSYDWEFIPIPGRSFRDFGSDTCIEVNQPPLVDAGPDLTPTWPGSVALAGEVVDDGMPWATPSVRWSQVEGPGTATFADDTSPETSVTFSQQGGYLLRLSADDGEYVVIDDVSVIAVDPSTQTEVLEVAVRSGLDDVEESVADRSMYLDSSDLELLDDFQTAGSTQLVGVRFAGVQVPADATVLRSYLQLQVDEVSLDGAAIEIRGEASDDSAGFGAAAGNLSGRSRTTASVSWQPAPWPTVGAAGSDQRTPDLSSVIQEILDRPGWSSGHALTLVFEGSGRRTAESYDGQPSGAARLHVEYALSSEESPIDVPDVVGLPRASAESAIVAAGLAVGSIAFQSSETLAAGVVLAQDPADCQACAAPGDPVDLVVSSGPAPIDVPDVVGQPRAGAEDAIVAAGLSVGSVALQSSQTVAAGIVLAQDPADCQACAAPGDPVDLVVSNGPPNMFPSVSITTPSDGATLTSDSPSTFGATASDEEDGPLTAAIVWSSSKDGSLGTGATVVATLSTGRHTITATVSDSGGATASDAISVHVRKGKGP